MRFMGAFNFFYAVFCCRVASKVSFHKRSPSSSIYNQFRLRNDRLRHTGFFVLVLTKDETKIDCNQQGYNLNLGHRCKPIMNWAEAMKWAQLFHMAQIIYLYIKINIYIYIS